MRGGRLTVVTVDSLTAVTADASRGRLTVVTAVTVATADVC